MGFWSKLGKVLKPAGKIAAQSAISAVPMAGAALPIVDLIRRQSKNKTLAEVLDLFSSDETGPNYDPLNAILQQAAVDALKRRYPNAPVRDLAAAVTVAYAELRRQQEAVEPPE